jgi:hypothetical protein
MTSIADVSVCIQTGSRVCPHDAFLVRGGRADHPLASQARRPFCHQLAGALGPPFRALRGHRFSGRARRATKSSANAHWRRSLSGSCPRRAALHGLVRARAPALPLGALALSCQLEPSQLQKPCARSFSPICSPARLPKERHTGQLVDRAGNERVVFDIDGTRQAARQRALPVTEELPAPQRRLNQVCAPGYTGRKRGQVVRTRTVVSQAHSYHWLGSFGNSGNGLYREELRRALSAIGGYLQAHQLSPACALLRLDGPYGTGAVIADLAGFSFVMRGKDYSVLDREPVQSRLHLPSDQQFSRWESGLVRQLYDCPDVAGGPEGVRCRVVVATHPAGETKSRIGSTRKGVVYELFFTQLPQEAFTACDVVALYLHRGAFEPLLADEDQEQDPDRWCSHAPAGQEAWQIVSQWVSPLRLELGHVLKPTPMRTTQFAPPVNETPAEQVPVQGYGKPSVALPWKADRFSGQDFVLQPDGALCCPAGKTVRPRRLAPRSRWQSARALQRQNPRLSRLPVAQAVSVAWGSHHEAASDQCPAASSAGWSRAAASFGIGAGESTGVPVCTSCDTNTSR